jgi:hypothetical protein
MSKAASYKQLLGVFAVSIHAKVKAINEFELLTKQEDRLLESISDDIKKVSNFTPRRVSVAAKKEADALEIDLREEEWTK